MFVQEFIEQLVKLGGVFFFQDQSVGEHTVTGAVLRGITFSFGGDGSFGAGSVGAGGGDLFGSSHGGGSVQPGSKDQDGFLEVCY